MYTTELDTTSETLEMEMEMGMEMEVECPFVLIYQPLVALVINLVFISR